MGSIRVYRNDAIPIGDNLRRILEMSPWIDRQSAESWRWYGHVFAVAVEAAMKWDFKFPQILPTFFVFKLERVLGTCRYAGHFLQKSSNEPGIFSPLALLCHIVCRMNAVELVWLSNELKDS